MRATLPYRGTNPRAAPRDGDAGFAGLTRTKLVPPRLPAHTVATLRHARWLDAILGHSLCLVRAPSGYGKSTLCTGWYQALVRRGIKVGWLSIDRDDDDPARAIPYIFEAVRGGSLSHDLVYDALTPPQSLATQFINAILVAQTPFVLFLDDLDRLTDPRILQFLNYVLLHCPDNLHIVGMCQANPALPLSYLDTHAMLLRVGTEELRLSDGEARELLTTGGNPLGDAVVAQLNEAMGGWVTGLRIGSAALRNNRDALFDIGLVSHGAHWLSDYLDENIFRHLTPMTRQFLMRCAIVEQMTAELCEALSGEAGAAQMLTWLADQNLFIQRLDDAGTRYRIHPVFREFLLARLAQEQPGLRRTLHRAASDWFARAGALAEAIGHAFDAGETDRAAVLVNRAAMAMVEHSDIVALLGWIARLPDEVVAAYIPLRLAQAWALTLSLRPQARTLIDQLMIDVAAIDNARERARLEQELAGIETVFLAVYEDRLDLAVVSGYAFLAGQPDENSFVTRAVRNATAYCEINRGQMHLVHDLVRPGQLAAQRREQIFPTAYRHCIVGMGYRAQGALAEAERIFVAGLALAEEHGGRQAAASGLLAAFLARSLYERGDLDGAAALLADRMPTIDEAAFHEAVINAYRVLIRVAASRGAVTQAVALIDHAELIGHERGWRRLLAMCMGERVRLRLPLTTDPERLAPYPDKAQSEQDLLSLDMRTYILVCEARATDAAMKGDAAAFDKAAACLARFVTASRFDPLSLRLDLLRMTFDLRAQARPELTPAMRGPIIDALARGYRRTIIDKWLPLDPAAMHALIAGDPALAPLQPLLDAQIAGEERPVSRSGNVFTILTSREIDVLTGVGRGDSNKEIARRLHLTPETVKWHLKNVMRKLNAQSRAEAVANAASLGLSLSADSTA